MVLGQLPGRSSVIKCEKMLKAGPCVGLTLKEFLGALHPGFLSLLPPGGRNTMPPPHCFHSTSERQGSALTLETKRGWHNCSSWWGSFRARALGSRSGSDRPTTRSTHTSRSTKAEPPGSGWISWKTKLWKIKQWDAFPVQKANSLE